MKVKTNVKAGNRNTNINRNRNRSSANNNGNISGNNIGSFTFTVLPPLIPGV